MRHITAEKPKGKWSALHICFDTSLIKGRKGSQNFCDHLLDGILGVSITLSCIMTITQSMFWLAFGWIRVGKITLHPFFHRQIVVTKEKSLHCIFNWQAWLMRGQMFAAKHLVNPCHKTWRLLLRVTKWRLTIPRKKELCWALLKLPFLFTPDQSSPFCCDDASEHWRIFGKLW